MAAVRAPGAGRNPRVLLAAYLRSELLRDAERQCRFARPGGSREEQSTPGHLFGLNEVHHDAARLAGLLLAHEARRDGKRHALLVQPKAFDMGVHGNALGLGSGGDFFDFHLAAACGGRILMEQGVLVAGRRDHLRVFRYGLDQERFFFTAN